MPGNGCVQTRLNAGRRARLSGHWHARDRAFRGRRLISGHARAGSSAMRLTALARQRRAALPRKGSKAPAGILLGRLPSGDSRHATQRGETIFSSLCRSSVFIVFIAYAAPPNGYRPQRVSAWRALFDLAIVGLDQARYRRTKRGAPVKSRNGTALAGRNRYDDHGNRDDPRRAKSGGGTADAFGSDHGRIDGTSNGPRRVRYRIRPGAPVSYFL